MQKVCCVCQVVYGDDGKPAPQSQRLKANKRTYEILYPDRKAKTLRTGSYVKRCAL
jgi:hypothetical protein